MCSASATSSGVSSTRSMGVLSVVGRRSGGGAFLAGAGAVFAGAGGGVGGELGVGGGVPADAGEGEVADDESRVLVGCRPDVGVLVVSPVGAGGALPFPAGGAEVLV